MNDPFFGNYSQATMRFGDNLTCVMHMPRARKSTFTGGEEDEQSLPEANPRSVFLVDEYPAAPEEWMRSTPTVMSYMVPVKAEHGLWLDFNRCTSHTHDVAVYVSAQGVNALRVKQKADTLRLEQYRNNCPIHDLPFGADRRCASCGHKWAPQNYLATTGTPSGLFWLDGFCAPDGVVRQFVFTLDQERGVANAVLGAERVHAIGVAFFLSKEPKPVPVYEHQYRSDGLLGGGYESTSKGSTFGRHVRTRGESLSASSGRSAASPLRSMGPQYELAAGARIRQKVYADPKDPSYWQDTPAGMIVINYASEEVCRAVVQAGKTPRSEGELGSLGIPLGHK